MATIAKQQRWRDRKRSGEVVPTCECGKKLRLESRDGLCRACWLKAPEGKACNQHTVALSVAKYSKPQEAKRIASKYRELGFVNIRALEESDKREELEVIQGVGFAHFHHRRDKQTTLYSLAVLPEHRNQGWGRLLFYRVLASAIENGCDRIFLKCPKSLESNRFYERIGMVWVGEESGNKQPLNHWEYRFKLPLLFVCNGGGTSEYDRVAQQAGWRLGIQSTNKEGKPRKNKDGWHMEMVDNEWEGGYRHHHHLELIKANKPLVATVRDLTSVEQLPEVLKQAREISQYCGRVLIVPKVKTWLPQEYWLAFSVPTPHGSTSIEPEWFSDRPVHLLGGSPDKQAEYAKLMNVVSLDGKYAMHDNVAGKGKSAWQGCNGGVKVVDGCYESFRVSLEKQKQYWHADRLQSWADDPLFRVGNSGS